MNEDNKILNSKEYESSDISFSVENYPDLIVLKENGDIFVKGKLCENDKELVQQFREFLKHCIY